MLDIKKSAVCVMFTMMFAGMQAQEKPVSDNPAAPVEKKKGTEPVNKKAETEFQDKKLAEAEDKQEARRKAMKDRAKEKEKSEK